MSGVVSRPNFKKPMKHEPVLFFGDSQSTLYMELNVRKMLAAMNDQILFDTYDLIKQEIEKRNGTKQVSF